MDVNFRKHSCKNAGACLNILDYNGMRAILSESHGLHVGEVVDLVNDLVVHIAVLRQVDQGASCGQDDVTGYDHLEEKNVFMIGFLFIIFFVWNGIDNILARQFIVVEFERKNLVFYLNENAI